MKTFLECVKEAASVRNLKAPIKTLYFELPQELIETLKEAADMYATQSNSHKPVVVRGGDKKTKSVKRDKKFYNYPAYKETPNTPTEPLATEARDTVAAGRTCDKQCTGPWDCQCQDVLDAFYRTDAGSSHEGQP